MKKIEVFLLVALVGLMPLIRWDGLTDFYHISRFVYLAMVLCVGVVGISMVGGKRTVAVHGLDVAMMGWLVWSAITIGWSFNKGEAIFEVQKIFLYGLLYTICRHIFSQNGSVWRVLVWCNVAATLLVCWLVSYKIGMLDWSKGSMGEKSFYGVNVVSGHRNLVASYLYMLLVFNIFGILSEGILKGWKRYVAGVLIVWQFILLALLQSRQVYVSLGASSMVLIGGLWVLRFTSRAFVVRLLLGIGAVGVVVGCIVVITGAADVYLARFNVLNYASSETALERGFVWYKTRQLIAEYWTSGVGIGHWKLYFPKNSIEGAYRLYSQNVIFTRPHNDFYWVLSELGIVGILFFVSKFILGIVWSLRGAFRSVMDYEMRLLLLCIGSGLVGYCLFSAVDFPLERIEHQVLLHIWLAGVATVFVPVKRFSVPIPRGIYWVGVPIFLSIFWVGYLRIRCETHIHQVLISGTANRYDDVRKHAMLAYHPLTTLMPSGMPIKWYQAIAEINLKLDDEQNALPSLQEAYKNAPYEYRVLHHLGAWYFRHKQYEQALPYLQQAAFINPRQKETATNLMDTYLSLGRTAQAIEAVEALKGDSITKNKLIEKIKAYPAK
jgi:tetratricopeptide (TPR) repeat protein